MSRKLRQASIISVATMIAFVIASAGGSGAVAQAATAAVANQEPAIQTVSQPVVQPLPVVAQPAVEVQDEPVETRSIKAASLSALVNAQPQPSELSRELQCLAGAIYFEAKSESLTGQLAVGRVIVARSKSGRFPNSYCGVVYQPSQFSFVRGQSMPGIRKGSQQWKNAVAIAQIAHSNAWASPVEGALFFHAAYVSPGWKLKRVGRVENHIFYR
ncbi:MAG TPA: cell wall hydrolase [Novosphingobium sp.]|nr:cell wall hydrolase [Novosphingobium sp.]HQA17196.1 cell wall hydrolase [Novosphingobium sp.]